MALRGGWLPFALAAWAALCAAAPISAQTPAEEARLAASSLLLDAAGAGPAVIAVGQRGHILRSTDGSRWTQARTPVQILLTAIHMHDARTGWAVGHDAAVLRTRDGGESWNLVHYAPDMALPLLDIWFRDAETGFAVGAFGIFLATTDSGDTWTCKNGCLSEDPDADAAPPFLTSIDSDFADDFHLNAIVPAGGGRVFLAGEAGALYRSDNDGETWRALDSPYGGSWFAGLALDRSTLLIAGLRGHLFRSEDSGNSWAATETGTTATLTDIVSLPQQQLLITGLSGTLLLSSDGGRSASLHPLPSRAGIAAALAAPSGALLFGEFGAAPMPALR